MPHFVSFFFFFIYLGVFFIRFEKYTSTTGSTRYGTIGFATVYQYYAYPNHTRPRIAQILILPPFQSLGLGTELLKAIYREYVGRNEVKDITGKRNNEFFSSHFLFSCTMGI